VGQFEDGKGENLCHLLLFCVYCCSSLRRLVNHGGGEVLKAHGMEMLRSVGACFFWLST
jgi:hypothetical protein